MATGCDLRKPPHDPYLDDLPRCKNCGQPFEEHHAESEPPYHCPYEYQMQPSYGFFNGGDPREFHPDYESSSPEEIANHRRACEEAERLESMRGLPCPSGYEQVEHEGKACVAHVLRAPFGMGITTFPPTCYEQP
jgi:hypothetical protein